MTEILTKNQALRLLRSVCCGVFFLLNQPCWGDDLRLLYYSAAPYSPSINVTLGLLKKALGSVQADAIDGFTFRTETKSIKPSAPYDMLYLDAENQKLSVTENGFKFGGLEFTADNAAGAALAKRVGGIPKVISIQACGENACATDAEFAKIAQTLRDLFKSKYSKATDSPVVVSIQSDSTMKFSYQETLRSRLNRWKLLRGPLVLLVGVVTMFSIALGLTYLSHTHDTRNVNSTHVTIAVISSAIVAIGGAILSFYDFVNSYWDAPDREYVLKEGRQNFSVLVNSRGNVDYKERTKKIPFSGLVERLFEDVKGAGCAHLEAHNFAGTLSDVAQ